MRALRTVLAVAIIWLIGASAAFAQASVANYCFNPNGSQATNNQWTPCPAVATITGNATGTTGAVVGTLAGVAGKTTYICGFSVSAIGGTAAVGPITIANTVTASLVYELASSASGNQLTQTFTPCIPANATNTSITITTTADGTASNVAVNSWGFQR
jgi:hypothetical protein